MNDNERIEAALAEIRGSACVSEDMEHWTGTVRDILTRLVATTREQAIRKAVEYLDGHGMKGAAEDLRALLPEAPQKPTPTPEGETVMVRGTDDEIFWSCEVCKAEFAKFPGIRKYYQHCPGCGRRILDWKEGR